jgi:hypothetical protein
MNQIRVDKDDREMIMTIKDNIIKQRDKRRKMCIIVSNAKRN